MNPAVNNSAVAPVLRTLAIGLAGATVATLAGLPAAPLVGASILVSFGALFKLTADIPSSLRNIAFSVIGCTLGSGITKEALARAVHWPVSLLVLCGGVVLILVICSWILRRFFAQTAETSVLATAPGAFAYSLAIAGAEVGDVRTIMVIQSTRLLLVTALLPFILDHFGLHVETTTEDISMTIWQSVAVVLLTFACGFIINKWRVPAAYLIAGMLVSGLGHYLGIVTGRPPASFLFIGFAITGSMIGARFSSLSRDAVRDLALASFIVFMLSGLITLLLALPVAALLDLPPGQVFTAYAPGGVEAMAAMAIALGYDPAFVATHHIFRLLLLFLVLPLAIKFVGKIAVGRQCQ